MRLVYPGSILPGDWQDFGSGAPSSTYRWMLLDPDYEPFCGHEFVADVVAEELTDGSYARVDVTSPTGTPDLGNCRTVYDCDDPTWAALAGGEIAAYAVMFRVVTNDADSTLMYLTSLAHTADGSDFTPPVSSSGLVITRTNIDCATGSVF